MGSSSIRASGLPNSAWAKQDADFLAALELAHLAVVEGFANVEAVEEDGGVGFGGVAVFVADDAFELAEAHAVFVRHLGLFVDAVALFDSAAHSGSLPMITVSMTR